MQSNGVRRPPPVFYKFYPIEAWLPSLFTGASISFSSRVKFNDPFDCRPGFRLGSGPSARKYLHDKFKATTLSPSRRIKAVNAIMNRNAGKASMVVEETQKMLDGVGILCLTTRWDNALMWSHYAADHTGICIGFRSNVGIFQAANPVAYSQTFPVIDRPGDDETEMFRKTFLTKAKCWEYEDEWRITKNKRMLEDRDQLFRDFCTRTSVTNARALADLRGSSLYSFDNSAIESATLGMRSAEKERLVIDALSAAGLTIPLYRVNSPSTTYLLSRHLVTEHLMSIVPAKR